MSENTNTATETTTPVQGKGGKGGTKATPVSVLQAIRALSPDQRLAALVKSVVPDASSMKLKSGSLGTVSIGQYINSSDPDQLAAKAVEVGCTVSTPKVMAGGAVKSGKLDYGPGEKPGVVVLIACMDD